MPIVRNFFLLLQTKDLAQLAYSNVVSSVVKNRLNLWVAMRPGFLRARWQPEILSLEKWHGMTNCLNFLSRQDSWNSNRTM
jgi:hypothetical protein